MAKSTISECVRYTPLTRWHTSLSYLLVAAMLVLPTAASAQVTLISIINAMAAALAPLVTIAFGIAFIVFIWAVVTFVRTSGSDTDIAAARTRLMWSVFGLFIIASMWGIVAVIRTLFGVDTGVASCASPVVTQSGVTACMD